MGTRPAHCMQEWCGLARSCAYHRPSESPTSGGRGRAVERELRARGFGEPDLFAPIPHERSPEAVVSLKRPEPLLYFFNRFVRQQKSDIIDDDGNVIQKPGETYNEDGVRALY